MSHRQGVFGRNGFFTVGTLAILALVALFYATVNGAVDRASQRRAALADGTRLSALAGTPGGAPRLAALTAPSR